MFNEYEMVRLIRDILEQNLVIGDVGVVLIIHDEPGLPRAYEVDFSDYDRRIVKVVTLFDQDIERAVTWK